MLAVGNHYSASIQGKNKSSLCQKQALFLRDGIKSYGKFAIFKRLKIGGGWMKRADFGKIKTKDRNFHVRDF